MVAGTVCRDLKVPAPSVRVWSERRPYGTPVCFWDRFPALKRWANERCAYGAGFVRCAYGAGFVRCAYGAGFVVSDPSPGLQEADPRLTPIVRHGGRSAAMRGIKVRCRRA